MRRKRIGLFGILALALPLILISCGGGGGGNGGPGTVAGTVRANGGGAAIAGATVSVFHGQTLLGTTTTDANGHFAMSIQAEDGYTVVVDSAGFMSAAYNSVDIVAGETITLKPILLLSELFPGLGTISGIIKDSLSGMGVAGVTVSLREELNAREGAVLITGITDSTGQYSIADVPAGYYTAELAKAGYATAFVSICSLGGQVSGNQNASISLLADLAQGTLAGAVRDSVSGLGVAGATVDAYNGAALIGATSTDANGQYTLSVPAGVGYTVQVRAPGYTPLSQNGVSVAGNATTTLNLNPQLVAAQGTLSGFVRDSVSGTGIAGATVEVYNGATLIGTTTTDANGSYTLSVPAGGGYTVQISAAGYNALNQNGVSVAGNATTTLNLNPQLVAAQGALSGFVRDSVSGTGIAGATVEVYNGATLIGTTTTDANGSYTLSVPAGGGYTVQISAAGYNALNQNGVSVAGNATTTLNLNPQLVAAQGTLDGVVRNFTSGVGIAGATVEVYNGATLIGTTTTDANGNYSVDVAAGNDYTVEIDSAGFIPAAYNNVDIVADETTILESILQIADSFVGNGTVAGTVKDSLTGNGLAGVTVNLRAGFNTQTGAVVVTGTTNGAGQYSIANVPTGYYTAELSRTGYITAFISIYSLGGQVSGNQNASISPVLAAGETRIVLTWGAAPADLDSHLTGPKTSGGRFHIYYNSTTINDGTVAGLDADDTGSYGPETVTLSTQIAGVYRFSVYDYTNRNSLASTALSNSGAQVKVYQASGLVATYNIPSNVGGTLWAVFELSGNTLTVLNTLSYNTNETTIP